MTSVAGKLNEILARTFAPYLETKNFRRHLNGPYSATTIWSSTSRPNRF
jgi:hypothetical protein